MSAYILDRKLYLSDSRPGLSLLEAPVMTPNGATFLFFLPSPGLAFLTHLDHLLLQPCPELSLVQVKGGSDVRYAKCCKLE